MNNVKFGFADIVSYTIPGIVMLSGVIILLNGNIKRIENILEITKEINFAIGILIIGIGYVLGFASYGMGSFIYKKIGLRLKIWKLPPTHVDGIDNSKRYILIREFSENNSKIIDRWMALKGMSQNFSFVSLFFAITCLLKYFITGKGDINWIILSLLCFLLTIVFINRTNQYHKYREWDMENIVNAFNLEDKSIERKEKEENME